MLLEIVLEIPRKNESKCAKICTLFTRLGFKIDSLLWSKIPNIQVRLLKFEQFNLQSITGLANFVDANLPGG